jgi:hypothetical protein
MFGPTLGSDPHFTAQLELELEAEVVWAETCRGVHTPIAVVRTTTAVLTSSVLAVLLMIPPWDVARLETPV